MDEIRDITSDIPETPSRTEEYDMFDNQRYREGEERIQNLTQNRTERKIYADRIYNLVTGWLVFIAFIIFLNGFAIQGPGTFTRTGINLSDDIILALIGGTTVNVLGLFFVVLKYLFNPKKDEENETLSP